MKRLSSFSEIYSKYNQGTVSLAQVWSIPPQKPLFSSLEIGVICVPPKSEQICGDAWAEKSTKTSQQLILADGLGHGIFAAKAADEATRVFSENDLPAAELIELLHVALKNTVGAVVGLVEIQPGTRKFSFTGIGNIEGKILNGTEKRSLLSHNGTVGHTLQTVRRWDYEWQQESILILHSDGISNKWDLENYPGLSARHPSVIAGVIYRDFRRERDDACVIVLREPPEPLLPR